MAYRIEKDFLGEKQVPADAYYGVQTVRGSRTSTSQACPCPGSRISSRPLAT
jgi:aspartate ammonia-lyase